jgi:uncharacterized RDD family membrane protein YckC
MIRAKVVIASSRESVWRWLMEPANWKLWDNGDLLEVTPGWQAGATMKWAIGLPSKLASYQEGSVLGIESEYLLSTIGLSSKEAGMTEVEIIEVPQRGAGFSDAGVGRIAQLDKNLAKLKQQIECQEAFLNPIDVSASARPGNEEVKTNLEAVKSESIPAFNLIWPPAESPRPTLQPKTNLAAPRKTVQARYASIWLRFVAFVIDGFALMIPSMIVVSVISPPAASSQNPDAARGFALILLVGWWLYFAIMESSAKGATLGKMLLHLRVTDMKGDRISFARATGRFFAKALGILTFYIGFLIAVFTAKKQALHDLISGCLVVREKKS